MENSIGHAGLTDLAEMIKFNCTLRSLFVDRSVSGSDTEVLDEAVDVNPTLHVHLTPAQRLAFLMGHIRPPREGEMASPVRKLPLDVIRRILLKYTVAQGRRWSKRIDNYGLSERWQMKTTVPEEAVVFR